jgi:hypothetical protein
MLASLLLWVTLAAVGPAATAGALAPRPHFQAKARFARWLVHESGFAVVASRSAHLGGTPFPHLLSVSDGRGPQDCAGAVHMYIADMMPLTEDLRANDTVTVGFYEAAANGTDPYCVPGPRHDPQDPTCAKLHVTGALQVLNASASADAAAQFLFWRHPAMRHWPATHNWHVAVLRPQRLELLDFYGGAAVVPVSDYWAAPCP